MIEGVMLLWFVLAGLSLLFVVLAKGLKHGMMTVRDDDTERTASHSKEAKREDMAHAGWAGDASRTKIFAMALLSFVALGLGVAVATVFGSLGGGLRLTRSGEIPTVITVER